MGFDSCVVVAAQYVSKKGSLNEATLQAALGHVIREHASLGVQISTPNDKPCFIRLPSVAVSQVVTFSANQNRLDTVLAEQFSQPFEVGSDSPLWRLTIMPDDTVIFAYHHSIGDGQSGLAFHHSLLSALNKPHDTAADPQDVIPIPSSHVLRPPVENLTNVSVSFKTLCRTFYDSLCPESWTAGFKAWTLDPVAKEPNLQVDLRLWEIPAADVTDLLQTCREHGTTLTGALYALAVKTMSRVYSETEPTQPRRFTTMHIVVAVSLRRFTGTSALHMCDEVSAHYSYPPLLHPSSNKSLSPESFPWVAAAEYSSTLRKGVKPSREVVGTIRYLYSLGISKQYFLGMLGQKRGFTLEISNVGQFPSDTTVDHAEKPWSIGSMHFGQCDAVTGGLKLSLVGSPSGTVNVVFSWGIGSVEEAVADSFVIGFKQGIASILAKSET